MDNLTRTSRGRCSSLTRLIRPRVLYSHPPNISGRRQQFTFCTAATLRSIPLAARRIARLWLDSVILTSADAESRPCSSFFPLECPQSASISRIYMSYKQDGVGYAIMFLGQARKSMRTYFNENLHARTFFFYLCLKALWSINVYVCRIIWILWEDSTYIIFNTTYKNKKIIVFSNRFFLTCTFTGEW